MISMTKGTCRQISAWIAWKTFFSLCVFNSWFFFDTFMAAVTFDLFAPWFYCIVLEVRTSVSASDIWVKTHSTTETVHCFALSTVLCLWEIIFNMARQNRQVLLAEFTYFFFVFSQTWLTLLFSWASNNHVTTTELLILENLDEYEHL